MTTDDDLNWCENCWWNSHETAPEKCENCIDGSMFLDYAAGMFPYGSGQVSEGGND
jgi:hypothetical protein